MQTDPGDIRPGVRDELLGAVDHPLAVAQPRPRARVAGIRSGLWLGQPERPQALSGAQPRQPLELLLLVAVEIDRLGPKRGVRAQGDRHRRVDPRELLDDEGVGERVAATATVLLREWHPHQTEPAELGDDLVGERLGPVELLGHGRHLALGELPHGGPDQLVIGREVEVHDRAFSQLSRPSMLPGAPRPPDPRPAQPRAHDRQRGASAGPAGRPPRHIDPGGHAWLRPPADSIIVPATNRRRSAPAPRAGARRNRRRPCGRRAVRGPTPSPRCRGAPTAPRRRSWRGTSRR